jgi:3'-phosphoadenosine 5'-phosphosulfate sulfotransferase (PAPS reductase)/FAD synthetase
MQKKKLIISFSGGETSAFMSQWILNNKKDEFEIVCVFANTGQENEETLDFVEKCDKEFNLNLVWVEAVINPKFGEGVRHRIVDYKTASRNGQPFEDLISKMGMPNQSAPFCTRDLKLNPIKSYLRSIGWKKYWTAIGIRADEFDRINPNRLKERLYYPLVSDIQMTKPMVNFWWNQQPFRLNLKGYQGNCKWCYKKSTNKLLTICVENPEYFDFPKKMEEKYENYVPNTRKNYDVPIRFFRGNKSVNDLFELSKAPFKKSKNDATIYTWQTSIFDDNTLDLSNGCEESCEVY